MGNLLKHILIICLLGLSFVYADVEGPSPFDEPDLPPSVFIGDSGMSWNFTYVQLDELNISIEALAPISDSLIPIHRFIVSLHSNNPEVTDHPLYTFDISLNYTLEGEQLNYDIASNLPSAFLEQEFMVQIPYDILQFHLSAGSTSTVIDGSASTQGTSRSNSNKICRDDDNVLHVSYLDSSNQVSYIQSSDNGTTWVNKSTVGSVGPTSDYGGGIVCNKEVFGFPPDMRLTQHYNQNDILAVRSYYEKVRESQDGGASWVNTATLFDWINPFNHTASLTSCTASQVGGVDCCTVRTGKGHKADFYYNNYFSTVGTLQILYNGTVENAAASICDIQSVGSRIFVAGADSVIDDIIMFHSSNKFINKNNNFTIYNGVSLAGSWGLSFVIAEDESMHLAFIDNADLQYCRGKHINNWNDSNNWDCLELDASASYRPSIAVSTSGAVHILYSSSTGYTGDVFLANTSDYNFQNVSKWDVRVAAVPEASSGHPSIADSYTGHAGFDNVGNRIDFVYQFSNDVKYNNYSIESFVDCQYNPTRRNWDIHCEDECYLNETYNIVYNGSINITGWGNVTFYNATVVGFRNLSSIGINETHRCVIDSDFSRFNSTK